MSKPAKQDEFKALIQQAMALLYAEQAEGVVLVATPSTEESADVDFAGNTSERNIFGAFGHMLGQSMAKDPEMGLMIGLAIKKGTQDFMDGKDNIDDKGESISATKH